MKIISGHLNVTDPTIPKKGPTPPGAYQLTQKPVALDPEAYPLFCSGNECWWTPYEPLFETPNKRCLSTSEGGSGRCGIHPTSSSTTAGCSGIPGENNAEKLRKLIEKYGPTKNNPLPVLVSYE